MSGEAKGRARVRWATAVFIGAAAALLLAPRLGAAAAANLAFLQLNKYDSLAALPPSGEGASQAQALLQTGLRLSPANSRAWRGLGFLWKDQDSRRALEAWQAAGNMGEELLQWGHRARQRGDLAQAAAWYDRTIALHPGNTDAYYYRGQIFEEAGAPAEARAVYERGLRQRPAGSYGRGDFYYRLGSIAAQGPEANWRLAAANQERALLAADFEDGYTRARALYALGIAERRLGRPEQALAAFDTLLAETPNHYWGLVQAAALSWEVRSDAERALALLERAIAIDPAQKRAYLQMGFIEEARGALAPAVAAYRQALAIDPQDTEALRRLEELAP